MFYGFVIGLKLEAVVLCNLVHGFAMIIEKIMFVALYRYHQYYICHTG